MRPAFAGFALYVRATSGAAAEAVFRKSGLNWESIIMTSISDETRFFEWNSDIIEKG
jgi:hypothetical protein